MSKERPFNTSDDRIPSRVRPVMNDIAGIIDGALQQHAGERMGFVLLTFNFGEGGTMSYISNAEREDVLRAMNEFITRNAQ